MTDVHDSPELDAELTEVVLAVLRRHIPDFTAGAGIERLVLSVRSDDVTAAERNFHVYTARPREVLALALGASALLTNLARDGAEAGNRQSTAVEEVNGSVKGAEVAYLRAPADEDFDDEVVVGSVRIDTASLLLVDPCHLAADVVGGLLSPSAEGLPAPGVLLGLIGDGDYEVVSTPDGIEVVDPYGDEAYPHQPFTADEWRRLTSTQE